MKHKQINPCFCKGVGELIEREWVPGVYCFVVKCISCGSESLQFANADDAIDCWNEKGSPDSIPMCNCGFQPQINYDVPGGECYVWCRKCYNRGRTEKTKADAIASWRFHVANAGNPAHIETVKQEKRFTETELKYDQPGSVMSGLEKKQKKQNDELQELAKLKAFYLLKISTLDVRINLLLHEASKDGAQILKIKSERGMDLTV